MTPVKLSRTRRKVYNLLVEGNCPAKVAEILGKDKGTVHHHQEALEKEGYVSRIAGTNPLTFVKGPRAALLDKAELEVPVGNDARGVKSNSIDPPPFEPPSTIFVPTMRGHVNGAVVFPVLEPGDLHAIAVPDGNNGNRRTVPLFPEKPYRDHHNSRSYAAKVLMGGEEITVHYWQSERSKKILIWPPAKELVPEQFGRAKELLMDRAQRVAGFLSKHGRWKLGLPEFRGSTEFATDDERILQHIPGDIRRIQGTEAWVDSSEGKREIETDNPENAKIIVEFPKVVRQLRDGQASEERRLYVLETRTERILEILEKLVKAAGANAEVSASLVEKSVLDAAEKTVRRKEEQGSEASEDEYEKVMYG